MGDKDVQLMLMSIASTVAIVIVLLFIYRVIIVLTDKDFRLKEDTYLVFCLLIIMCIMGYCVHQMKAVFKKLKESVV